MNRTLTILVCIMVAGVVVGASLPIFDSLTASSESVENEGAGWVRFALDKNVGTTYTLSYTEDENGFYIDNGTDRQTYDDSSTLGFDTILYADSNLSVWVDGAIHILGTNEGNPVYLEGNGAFTIVRDADGVTVTPEGEESLAFGVPTWSYIPVSTGNYGFFLASDLDSELGNGVKNYPSDMPLAVVGGGFAGVYAYNNIFRYDGLGLAMQPYYDDDGLFYGGSWSKTAAADTQSLNMDDSLDPSVINLDPSVIQPIDDPFNSGMSLMAVPTPSYTDGVWGYDLITVDNVQKAAIVSYSGTGGDIVVPATVGGYDVHRFGKTAPTNTYFSNNVFDNSALSAGSTLTISDGIVEIGSGAVFNAPNLTGSLVIPDSVTSIGGHAFYLCSGFTGSLVIHDSVTSIGQYAFNGCSGFTGSIVIPDSVTSIGRNAFADCTGLNGTLTLSKSLLEIGESAFARTSGLTGSVIIPNSVTTIGINAFNGCGCSDSLVVPYSVTTLSNNAFNGAKFTHLIIVSDAVPLNNGVFQMYNLTDVLDLSNTVDYSVDRYGIPANATVSDSIGDCFGFVSVVEYTIPGSGSATQELIAMLPLIMVLGLVLFAIGTVIWNRL